MPQTTFRVALALGVLAILVLAGCSTSVPTGPSTPGIYQSQTAPGATLDKQAAASMISELRRGKGLGPVALDPALNRMAEEQAAVMAKSGELSHSGSAGTFKQRIARSGYRNGGMWENVGAGHDTLADAFTGWRSSQSHLKNMLMPTASRMGIAAVRAPHSRYEVFWTLVLADPNDPRPIASVSPDKAPGETAADQSGARIAQQMPNFRAGTPGQIFVGSGVP
ncbi:CAP domain-containing protein [Hansschlegelia zhihuaiae]|uniref:CAP domain-containing protein n=1 Tax=Hansschlegelia zhihuaiae TaxID=405005 RepID=A0A4Q0M666_9HYPH|nr:CAP domain-containing protein [Hansschlegelia zhihuaiae]RXF68465.1 CAP domain-containing protein [Hansschlegelia zhihuaiae]